MDRGYERVVLSGHSSGGFYVAQFCADAVDPGKGHRLIEVDYWYHAISTRSLLQRFEEPPDRFASLVAASDLPMLMVCGSAESRVAAWRDLVEGRRTREKEFLVLDGADHNYIGSERPLADRITSFARRVGR